MLSRELLFVARDPIGEKPLYYYADGDRLIFASEIKAILHDPTVPRDVYLPGLSNLLAFGHAVAPDTIYRGIHKLLPGHYLLAGGGRIQIVQYWEVGAEAVAPADRLWHEEAYAERVRDLLDDAVRRRMVADVPVGAFLSGGVDSSAIVGFMRRHATGPVKTFSLGFAIGGAYDELDDARRVARYFETEHHELKVEHVDLVDTLQTLIYHYDEPFADAASFPLYLLSRFARQHVKVVLAGDGGDELFGGYRRYVAEQWAMPYQRLPASLQQWLPRLAQRLPRMRRLKRMLQTLPIVDPAKRYAHWLLLFTPEMQIELLKPEVVYSLGLHDPLAPYDRYFAAARGVSPADHLNQVMFVDLKTWLVDTYMEKTDKATMACSLEARLPLLDPRLVDLAFQIPSQYKIKGGRTKQILKRAVASVVPPEVLRKPKHGFSVPTDPWFRGDLKKFTFDVLFDERTRRRGYFNMCIIEDLWREHVAGREVWDEQLWLLLNLELWQRALS